MSDFIIFKAAFDNSATPAVGTYTAEGATAQFNKNTSLSPDYYLYNTADGTAVQWFVPTAETTDFEFVADILTRSWDNRVTYFIIADSTGTTRLRMWSAYANWHFENSDGTGTSGNPEYIGTINPTTSGGFGVFHQFRVRVRKLTESSSSVEVYVDGTLKLTATAGVALITCAKIGFVGGVNTFAPGTGAGIKNAYVYDLSGGDVVDRGVLSGAFNRFISWMKSKFALKSDIPTVNNGTLTIQKNGTDVQTFTANASTNATANITVPTKTSDLTNDSGFITEDTTKIPLAGSNAISGSLIPATTDAYDLGGSSYQWNNAYIKSLTINGVACGDILTHNASEFVDVSSNQTISGVKSFKDTIIRNFGNFTAGEAPTAQTTCLVLKHTNNDNTQNANSILSYMFTSGESMCELTQNPCIGSVARTWFRTNTDGSYSIYSYTKNGSLGTPGYKWKDVQTDKINGLNPGALSLPSNSYVNVDTTNFIWNAEWTYTPVFDGWLVVLVPASSATKRRYALKQDLMSYWYSNQNGEIFRFSMPVVKDVSVSLGFISDIVEPAAPTIYLLKSQGNV